MAISRIIVRVAGRTIADTTAALILRVADYVPVCDAHVGALIRSDSAAYRPCKGEASCFSIPEGGARWADAVWVCEKPHPGMERTAGYQAF